MLAKVGVRKALNLALTVQTTEALEIWNSSIQDEV